MKKLMMVLLIANAATLASMQGQDVDWKSLKKAAEERRAMHARSSVDVDGDIAMQIAAPNPAGLAAGMAAGAADISMGDVAGVAAPTPAHVERQKSSPAEQIFNSDLAVGVARYFSRPADLRHLAQAFPDRAESLKKLFDEKRAEVAALVERYGDRVLFGPWGHEVDAALWRSALEDVELVQILLEHGASMNARRHGDRLERTPLLVAAGNGLVARIQAFLDALPNDEARLSLLRQAGEYPSTAVHEAAGSGHLEAVRVLLNYLPTAEARRRLIEERVSGTRTALYLAAEGGNVEVVRELLKYLLTPEARLAAMKHGHGDWSALHRAARWGNRQMACALLDCLPDEMRVELILQPDRQALQTALHIAAPFGMIEVVRELLNYLPTAELRLALIEQRDSFGRTVLDMQLGPRTTQLLQGYLDRAGAHSAE